MKPPRPDPKSLTAETRLPAEPPPATFTLLIHRHLRIGWWTVLIFLTLGLVLEAFHGFKVEGYLKVTNETRRLMWTLAHAHGTLLGLVNLALAATLRMLPSCPEPKLRFTSAALLAATILMPAGFFLGGLFIYSGDPGLGILLVPVGGILLFAAVLQTALSLKYFNTESSAKTASSQKQDKPSR